MIGANSASQARKAGLAALVGSSLEWYEYLIYGTASALVFPKLFFSGLADQAALMVSFGTFGAAFVMRPLGAIVFGHFGDRVGRKKMLIMPLAGMGCATFLIGFLPSYQRLGIVAPLLLIVLRMVQGFCLGGEWGGAATVAVENAPDHRRGLYGTMMQLGVPVGTLLSSGVFRAVSSIPDAEFLSWGWRVPFWISPVLLGVALWIRMALTESPTFSKLSNRSGQVRAPALEVIRKAWPTVLLLIGAQAANNAAFFGFSTYSVAYATETVGLDRSVILTGLIIASGVTIVVEPIMGALSDRVGRRLIFSSGAILIALWSFPFFWLIDTGNRSLVLLSVVIGVGVCYATVAALNAPFYTEQFATRVRFTGSAMSYNLSTLLISAPGPVIAVWLVSLTGSTTLLSAYLVLLCLITVGCVLGLHETYRCSLDEDLTDKPPHEYLSDSS